MRLWHISLLRYLPNKQLVSQWRECCCIACNIAADGTPNHILVNKILDYPYEEFNYYTDVVVFTMLSRKYKVDTFKFYKFRKEVDSFSNGGVFKDWHTLNYLRQNMANLMEKHDCKGITDEEWKRLCDGYKEITGHDYIL